MIEAREGSQERGDLEQQSRLLYVMRRTLPPSVVPANVEARWQKGITLVGYNIEKRNTRQVVVTLHWRADQQIAASYTAFAHILKVWATHRSGRWTDGGRLLPR